MSANIESSEKKVSEPLSQLFDNAILLQQSKKYDEALTVYLKILDNGQAENITKEQSSVVSQNIALLYAQQNRTDMAYVYNKKALALNPRNKIAEQFSKESLSTYKVSEIPREIPPIEQLNNLGLKFIPFELLASLFIIFVFIVLKSFFNFIITQKKNLIENKNPTTLSWKFYGSVFILVLSASLLLIKNADSKQALGIIKSASTSVQTSAGSNQATITEIDLGHVVQILQTKEIDGITYAQIKVPGAFSGWIKKADIEPLN